MPSFTNGGAVGLVLAAGSASAAHRSGFWGSRYCLQGQTYGYPGHCQFSTFQSCQASASGTPAGELTEIRIGVATRKLTADNTLQLLGAAKPSLAQLLDVALPEMERRYERQFQ